MRNFSDLTEREVLALAIANEEEDGRIYADIAEGRVERFESGEAFLQALRDEAKPSA